ncbi:HNH endonuclease signature motif containing protein [Aspergillus homomorphus CBS 101889]|uniref:HNH nuclease domain-containing protein n=1 Tax=Aspergillus homomorphus (strain CBS 101889) TaxID=1450537 RepID=A0A395I1E1_ASPHC|nr:hypothetical protein BO97DRAFT_424151 [Aspergillus homomorphus CBS 101889]RAL12978.1 hypothetical protein BO97DRAFT_424151 [Aspergillus homomorphus CBS 101889]
MRWQKVIFSDTLDPTRAVGTVENLICLSSSLHMLWDKGYLVFRPPAERPSPDSKEMTVELFWRGDHQTMGMGAGKSCGSEIKSGDQVMLKTDDPKLRPLPSYDLLELHFVMQQLILLSGVGITSDEDTTGDEDDDGEDANMRIERWRDEIELPSECFEPPWGGMEGTPSESVPLPEARRGK